MKIRTALLTAAGLSVMLAGGAATAQSYTAKERPSQKETEAKAKVGEKAPEFMLTDTEGKSHKLSDFKGKTVVLQWINPDCPVCRRVTSSGIVSTMAKDLKELDENVVILAINSTHYMEADKSAKYLKKHELEMPALIDQDGTVGRLYGAKTTPHLYVIDDKGILRYQGAIDDDGRGTKGDSRMNFVVNAVKQIKNNETVSPDSTTPYGCGVKYAKK